MANNESVPVWRRELWSADDLAALFGCSRSLIFEMQRERALPKSVTLATNLKRWRAAEIRDWMLAGCPSLKFWAWEPTFLPTASDLLRQRSNEIEALRAELAALNREVEERRAALARLDDDPRSRLARVR